MRIVIHDTDAIYAIVLETIPSATVTKVQLYSLEDLHSENDQGELQIEFNVLLVELIAALQTLVRMK